MITFSENSDGSRVGKLDKPVRVGKEDVDRITLPALTGRHMRHAKFKGAEIDIGQLVDFASHVALPVGVVDELSAMDSMAVATEVAVMLGKSQGSGAPG